MNRSEQNYWKISIFPIQGGRKKKTRKVNKLSLSDYKKILKFYKIKIPKSASKIRKEGNKIIAKKFCSCIKKVRKKFKKEGIAIGMVKPEIATTGQKLKIDILGKMHDATILDESPYDPENKLLRA